MVLRRGIAGRARVRISITVLLCALSALAALTGPPGALAAPAPVPCNAIAGGKYDCDFYPRGDGYSAGSPVQASDATQVGYLNHGTNWVICQRVGGTVLSGAYQNDWWAWTQADDNRWGWVNAVWATGGDNDGQFGGVPECGSGVGLPPGAQAPPSSGSTVTPPAAPRARHLRVKLQLDWHVFANRTRIARVQFSQLPNQAHVRLGCRGAQCPFRVRTLTPRAAQRALARVFRSGDVIRLAVTAPGFIAEVVQLRFRTDLGPRGTIVSR